jgi:hypothetical protein
MSHTQSLLIAIALLPLAACSPSNQAPGNDTEAALDASTPAAPQLPAAQALAGVEPVSIQPELMNDADLAALGGIKGRCAFRLTRVAYPSLLYGNSNATIKLNGKLITLPLAAAGTYRDGPLSLTVSPADTAARATDQHEVRMVIHPRGAREERGYLGYAACSAGS